MISEESAKPGLDDKPSVWCPTCKHRRHPGTMCPVVIDKSAFIGPLTRPLDQDYIQCGCTYELGSVNAGYIVRKRGFQTS